MWFRKGPRAVVEVLRLQPGDRVLIECEGTMSMSTHAFLLRQWEDVLPEGVVPVVYDSAQTVRVLRAPGES